jgi:hypothetical protein
MKEDKLHNIKSTGFKTPGNYFDTLEDKILSRINESDVIKEIDSPGFSVPKDYFNTIEQEVLVKINNDDKPIVHLFARKSFYYVAGIAASLILLFAVFINIEKPDELTGEMVEAYFENSGLDTYDLAQLLSDADILEDDFTIIETNYNEDNLEDYLLENADIETILE